MSCTTTEFHYISLLTHLVSTVQCSLLVGIIQVDSLHVFGNEETVSFATHPTSHCNT